jgi:hypothetical protein
VKKRKLRKWPFLLRGNVAQSLDAKVYQEMVVRLISRVDLGETLFKLAASYYDLSTGAFIAVNIGELPKELGNPNFGRKGPSQAPTRENEDASRWRRGNIILDESSSPRIDQLLRAIETKRSGLLARKSRSKFKCGP